MSYLITYAAIGVIVLVLVVLSYGLPPNRTVGMSILSMLSVAVYWPIILVVLAFGWAR